MIRLDNVTKRFGGEPIFEDISLEMTPGSCIGLIGPNGAGKTTIFRLLTGEMKPDSGRVIVPKGMTVGLLPQTVGEMTGGTVLERTLQVKGDALELERKLEDLQQKLEQVSDPEQAEALSHEYGETEEAYKLAGGYELRADAKRILAGMGFTNDDLHRDVSELSGGWRMRLVLAGLLLQRPDVLLMDEPTNHLDVPSLEWIEGFLGAYEGTVVVISHDRYFLNRLVDQIASIEPDGLFVTPGNYDDYEVAVKERNEQRRREKEQQDKEIARIQEFIDKFRYNANKAAQVQSRIKKLEKIDPIKTVDSRKNVSFTFPEGTRSGKRVMTCEHVSKSYPPNTTVYEDLNLIVTRGERIALVGPNGQGKSTLLKLLAGVVESDSGTVEWGHNVELGYFAQHHIDGLNLDHTLLEEMESRASMEMFPKCRNILGTFLFSGDDVHKRIRVLSGGEKHRVALATLLLEESNLLLLDEPTNHLDMKSREVLKEALKEYGGTVILVSHDRAFLNDLATRTIHVEGGGITSYLGDYEYYSEKRRKEREANQANGAASRPADESSDDKDDENLSRKELRRLAAEERKLRKKRIGPLEKEFQQLERRIDDLEEERGKLAEKLADADFYQNAEGAEFAKVSKEHGELESKIEQAMLKWEELGEKIEAAEAELSEEYNELRARG
jgi:ATP-binding cassette subfamily F protein 3